MKKFLLIFAISLVLQGSFNIFASVNKNFADLLSVEKKTSVAWVNLEDFKNVNDTNLNTPVNRASNAEPDFSFGSTFKQSLTNDVLYLSCEHIEKPKDFYLYPAVDKYENYKVIITSTDQTTIEFEGDFTTIIKHPFVLSPGKYELTYIIYQDGIAYTSPKKYVIFAGRYPKPELGNPNKNTICVGEEIKIPIYGITEPGTKYTITYSNDPLKKDVYTDIDLPKEIKYTYLKKNSCGSTFETTGKKYPNAFGISLTATNECGETKKDAGPIYVSSEPKSTVKGIEKSCIGEIVTFSNSDEEATTPDQATGNCTTSEKRIWIISPPISNNEYEIDKGSLGKYGDPDKQITWYENGDNTLDIKFNTPGNYTVTLKLANDCFITAIDHPITIEPKITPNIKKTEEKIECDEGIFIFENTTVLPEGLESTPTFEWTIPKEATIQEGTVNSNIIKIKIERGNYKVSLTYKGTSCKDAVKEEDITVKGKPSVTKINDLNACIQSNGTVDIYPEATIETYKLIVTYNWTITLPDGKTLTSSDKNPKFTLTQIGVYKVKLILNSEDCGDSDHKEENFKITDMPVIYPVNRIVKCENQKISQNFTANAATTGTEVEIDGVKTNQKFYWTNDNTDIGLPSKGYGNIPDSIARNKTTQPITANITVYPLNDGCPGNSISFTFTVNPSKDTAPHDSIAICAGDAISPLKAVYNGVQNNPNADYQWYSTDGIISDPINGETSWQYTPDNKTWGTFYYFCKIEPKCDDPQKPCCDPFNTKNDTITILPKAMIKDNLITVAKSDNIYNLTPVDGVNQNEIPTGTKYKWTIISNGHGSIVGATEQTIDSVDNILQTLNLPDNFALPYDSILYQVTAISGSCQTTYQLTVRVVPGITANVICNDIKCFGETGSIEIKDIFGIMQGNTIVRLLDMNNNDKIIDQQIINVDKHTFRNLYQGNYKVSIVDANGISFPFIHTCSFAEPSLLVFDEKNSKAYDVKCKGESNGEIIISNNGGTPNQQGNYSYLWEKENVANGNYEVFSRYTDAKHLTGLAFGTYRVTVTDVNLCTVTHEFVVSEPAELFFTATGNPVLNCDDNPNKGGSIVISSPGGGNMNPQSNYLFTWTKKNQTNESAKLDINGINTALSDILEGVYTVRMYDNNNCTHTKDVKIDRAPALAASIDSLLVFDCANRRIFKQYTVTSSGGVGNHTVRWFDGLTELASGNTYVPDNSLNGKLITVRITDERACVFTLNVTPFVLRLPVFDFKTKKTACNKYQFEAIAPENVLGVQHSFRWNFSGQDSGQGKATEYDLDNLQVNSAGEYYVELIVLDNFTPCEYPVVRKTFKKNFIPDMKISSTGTVETVNNKITVWYCEGDTITVFGENANAYSWSNGSSKDNIKINHEGQFTLWGKNSDGCEGELNFETRFYKFGYEIVTDKDEINLGETVAFSTATFVPFTINYLWNFGDGTMNSTIELPYEHTYHFFSQDYFDILLTATNPKGCKEYATKRIKVNISSFPNTIMPGSIYEENRVFMKGCQVQIYNRNSVLIHEGADGWDGTHNGKPVMSDTYFYVLTYTQATGVQQTKKGYVTVIR